MLCVFQHRSCAAQARVWVFQVGGRVHRAAVFAVVAVLVFGTAFRAFAFDEAVRQKHVFFRVEKLLNGFALNQRAALLGRQIAQIAVNLLRQSVVFRRVGGMPVVKADVKTV